MCAAARRRRSPLRRSLVLGAFVIAQATLAAFLISAYLLVYRPAVQEIARAQLGSVAQNVRARLQTLVRRVEAVAAIDREWGRHGLLDPDDIDRYNRLMGGILAHGPDVSSAAMADENGREILLMRG